MLKHTTEPSTLMSLSEDTWVKILHVISAVALISAGFLFVLVGVLAVQNNEHIEEILNSPGVIERFNEARTKAAEKQTSPLLEQAEAFARYLEAQGQAQAITAERKADDIPPQIAVVPPKFKVYGTIYCEAKPELSLALIDEPGKGRHWVRQSDTVGRFLVNQIKDGLVVVTNGEETFGLTLEQGSETNSPKEVTLVSTAAVGQENSPDSKI